MTTAFQWVFDNAVDVQINKRGVVAQTTSRDQTIRAVSRGGQIWRFSVTPCPGLRWQDPGVRAYIEQLDQADRIESQLVNFNTTGLTFIFKYRGGVTNFASTAIAATTGQTEVTLLGFPPVDPTNQFIAKVGDVFQLSEGGRVYTVREDAPSSQSIIKLNRPISEASGTFTNASFGEIVDWKLICTSMPYYKITPTGIIEWSGNFEFTESLL